MAGFKFDNDNGTILYNGESVLTEVAPNLIGNPSFSVNQKGTDNYSAISSNVYIHDRWLLNANATSGSVDISTSTGIDPGEDTKGKAPFTALRIDVNSTDASVAASDNVTFRTGILDTDLARYRNNQVTFSFRVRANHSATYTMFARSPNADGSYVKDFTVSGTGSPIDWEKKTFTFTVDTTTGTWNDGSTRDLGMDIGISLMAGTNFHGTDGTWEAANDIATSNTDNFMDTATNWIEFTAFKLEGGDIATPYIDPDFNEEYQRALLYYQQSYTYSVAPGTATFSGVISFRMSTTDNQLTNSIRYHRPFRAPPTVTYYSHSTGNSGNVRNSSTSTDVTATLVVGNHTGFSIITLGSTEGSGERLDYHFTAVAEIV